MTGTNEQILTALATGVPKTNKDLIIEVGKPRRTIYSATRRLIMQGLVATRPSLRDTRQNYFFLTELGLQMVQA